MADSWWRAKKALDALPKRWEDGPNGALGTDALRQSQRQALEGQAVTAHEAGDVQAALARAGRVVEATYEVPYLHHATMEPLNCTAQVTPERVEVWLGTQNPEGALMAAAEVAGVGGAACVDGGVAWGDVRGGGRVGGYR